MNNYIDRLEIYLPSLLDGLIVTAVLCSVAITLGFFLSIFIHVLQCSNMSFIRRFISFYISLFRGTPILVQVLLCYFIPDAFGLDIPNYIAAIIALILNTAAYQSQILARGFSAIPYGQIEAAQICGLNHRQILWYIQVPQVLRITFPALLSELIDVIKASSIVSIIAVTDLMRVGQQLVSLTYRPMEVYIITAGFYLFLTSVVMFLGAIIESAWQRKLK